MIACHVIPSRVREEAAWCDACRLPSDLDHGLMISYTYKCSAPAPARLLVVTNLSRPAVKKGRCELHGMRSRRRWDACGWAESIRQTTGQTHVLCPSLCLMSNAFAVLSVTFSPSFPSPFPFPFPSHMLACRCRAHSRPPHHATRVRWSPQYTQILNPNPHRPHSPATSHNGRRRACACVDIYWMYMWHWFSWIASAANSLGD